MTYEQAERTARRTATTAAQAARAARKADREGDRTEGDRQRARARGAERRACKVRYEHAGFVDTNIERLLQKAHMFAEAYAYYEVVAKPEGRKTNDWRS